jgi:hypothetical protein
MAPDECIILISYIQQWADEDNNVKADRKVDILQARMD